MKSYKLTVAKGPSPTQGYKFRLRLLPVIIFTAIVFLIVKAKSYSVDIGDFPDIPLNSTMELWDVFCYIKSSAVLYISIWAGVTFLYLFITQQIKIKKTPIYIPMLIYTAMVILSYFMSDYKWMAFNGGVESFEGTRTILCYMFMLFYTINVVDEIRDAYVIVAVTLLGVFVACLIGITQLIGHDFFLSSIGKVLVAGKDLVLEGKFERGQVYQSVANMDYVGMYLSLIVPIVLYILYCFITKAHRQSIRNFGIDDKKRRFVVIFASVLLILILLNVYGAASVGGALGICVSVAMFLLIISKKKWQRAVILSASILGLVVAFAISFYRGTDNHRKIDYFETGIDRIDFTINGNAISILYDRATGGYELRDGEDSPLEVYCFENEDGRYQVDDDRFAGEVVLIPIEDSNGFPCVIVDVKDEAFGFTFYEDGAKYLNPFDREISLGKIASVGFENHLTLGTGRGYIWSRAIPLLKDRIFIGDGADTFMLIFPQDDYAGKYSAGSPLQVTCDKAHNMYLNMALGTGIISLIAFIAVIIMALTKAFKLGEDKLFIKVIAAGIIGFLFAGLFNDSNVCTMPMFFCMLGIVVAMSPRDGD